MVMDLKRRSATATTFSEAYHTAGAITRHVDGRRGAHYVTAKCFVKQWSDRQNANNNNRMMHKFNNSLMVVREKLGPAESFSSEASANGHHVVLNAVPANRWQLNKYFARVTYRIIVKGSAEAAVVAAKGITTMAPVDAAAVSVAIVAVIVAAAAVSIAIVAVTVVATVAAAVSVAIVAAIVVATVAVSVSVAVGAAIVVATVAVFSVCCSGDCCGVQWLLQ
jgi:hypothetical protein